MYVRRINVPIITAADGSATAYSDVITGKIVDVSYVKTDFADGVDFTLTKESNGQSIWAETNVNTSAIRAVRQLTYTQTGASITYAATFGVYDYIALAEDRVKVVIAEGGDTKSGTIIITVT